MSFDEGQFEESPLEVEAYNEGLKAGELVRDDLAMFVRRFIRIMKTRKLKDSLTEDAINYLKKKGLQGFIFRVDDRDIVNDTESNGADNEDTSD